MGRALQEFRRDWIKRRLFPATRNKRLSRETRQYYFKVLTDFIKFAERKWGIRSYRDLNQGHYSAYIQHLKEERKLSESTIQRKYKQALRQLNAVNIKIRIRSRSTS